MVVYSLIPLRAVRLVIVIYYITKDAGKEFFCVFFAYFTHATSDSLGLDNWGTWHRCWRRDLIVEWRNPITGEKLHWSWMGLEPRSLQIA